MKPGQILIAVLAAIAVAAVAVISAGGGDGGDSSDTNGAAPKAPADAVRLPFAYSPEKEKLLEPLIRDFNREDGEPS